MLQHGEYRRKDKLFRSTAPCTLSRDQVPLYLLSINSAVTLNLSKLTPRAPQNVSPPSRPLGTSRDRTSNSIAPSRPTIGLLVAIELLPKDN
ncbi:hypothetical protein CUC08_Gglean013367 [Alternaria sp. MG1]|nr:hypothetical protein CUC08_Gglean013367 [Alternaria sp. MG1]